ncbi:hypothetical protein BJ138DRAFT_1175146 [Hygrophoropsis aurantiaca]|uniref:Uncharacterized protein n=1 Tax=Hygrophoropsis aurantiaca TaxID=72124 RepID=A0ACB7ZX10_9AGAM|nr:hypothetical protein BJ138DRAFT_1175146 [Hygrophoropsis aurantiaca]
MSVARATLLVRPKAAANTTSFLQRRFGSHDSHAHEEQHDDAHYAPEGGFTTPFWRNTLLASIAAVAFYKFAPTPHEEVYLTRWMAQFSTPREVWARLNEKHLLLSQQVSDNMLLQVDAKRPVTHRYRYPASLDKGSPHLLPVGTAVDTSSVAAQTV